MLSFKFALSLKEQEQCQSSIYYLGYINVRSYKAKYNGSMIQ
jgi:hypothetical protein